MANTATCGLYHKDIMIITDNSSHQNDTPSCGVTCHLHSDDSSGLYYKNFLTIVIDDRK